MKHIIANLAQRAAEAEKSSGLLFKKLKKKPPVDLDYITHALHDQTFSKINCLLCANCCRNLGPRLSDKDIERLSKYLRIKPSSFTSRYLKLDEDGDYIFKNMPCPFLMNDNRCMVYDERPKACREYPHTDRKKFHQLLDLAGKNSSVCPAVFEILEGLKIQYMKK